MFDNLSHTPDWDDEDINKYDDPDNEGEEWKPNPTREACKELYQKWQQVMVLLNGALESVKTDLKKDDDEIIFSKEHWEDLIQTILGDAFQVAVKIKSSEAGGIYVIRMENASIIRKNAQYVASSLLLFMHEKVLEEDYVRVIRKEIDEFKVLFKQWVKTFEKDEFEDEWGLFI